MDSSLKGNRQAGLSAGFESSSLRPGRFSKLGTSRWAYLSIVVLAFLTFSNSLDNFFLMDDFWHLNKIAGLHWTDWCEPWSFSAKDNDSYWMAMHKIRGIQEASFFFRPAVTVLFGAIHAVSDGSAWMFHLCNILLHALTSLVFLGIARRFIGRNPASFGAALIFAVHPAHCESVQWIAANADLLAGLFFALAFYGHVQARQSEPGKDWGWSFIAAGSFLLALCSKEMSIMFPVMALFYDLLFYRPAHAPAQKFPRSPLCVPRFYGLLLIYAVIALLYLFQHFKVISSVTHLNEGGNYIADWRAPGFLSTILVNLATYLWHFWTFFPLMPVDTREAWKDVWWLVLPIWGALIVFYVWLGRKLKNKKQYHFFWGWQVLTVLPALPILMSQRVLYIPSIGFCLLVGLILKEHWLPALENRRLSRWLFPAAVLVCFLITFGMNTMWGKPSLMIRDQIKQISEELPKPEKGSCIYLIDIWPPSYGIEEGLRMNYGDRDMDIQVLSFSPKILNSRDMSWSDPLEKLFEAYFPEACGPLLTRHRLMMGRNHKLHLHLELENAVYFQGLVEGLLPVEPRLGNELKEVNNERFRTTFGLNPEGKVNKVDFYFADHSKKSYFLVFKDGRYKLISNQLR